MNTYKLTLIALLAALAVAGRLVLASFPNFQPVTAVIIIGGMYLGPIAAIVLALLVTFLSNVMLGMGIWTIWQIVAWSIIGILSGFLGKRRGHTPLYIVIIFSIFCGYFYGFIISLTTYHVTGQFIPYYLLGLPFDTNHAFGNAVFVTLLYPIISRFFKKYADNRFHIQNTN
ncbi:MAG TPA: ECF transporter S component [Bacillota bacterium]|nr:ECF transporter S component [Bacillota bacterium]